MALLKSNARIEIGVGSGIIRVTVPPRQVWLAILIEIAVASALTVMIYNDWVKTSLTFRVIYNWGIVGAALALVYQLSVTQAIEYNAMRLTVRKEIHGWERKKEYKIEDCSELESL